MTMMSSLTLRSLLLVFCLSSSTLAAPNHSRKDVDFLAYEGINPSATNGAAQLLPGKSTPAAEHYGSSVAGGYYPTTTSESSPNGYGQGTGVSGAGTASSMMRASAMYPTYNTTSQYGSQGTGTGSPQIPISSSLTQACGQAETVTSVSTVTVTSTQTETTTATSTITAYVTSTVTSTLNQGCGGSQQTYGGGQGSSGANGGSYQTGAQGGGTESAPGGLPTSMGSGAGSDANSMRYGSGQGGGLPAITSAVYPYGNDSSGSLPTGSMGQGSGGQPTGLPVSAPYPTGGGSGGASAPISTGGAYGMGGGSQGLSPQISTGGAYGMGGGSQGLGPQISTGGAYRMGGGSGGANGQISTGGAYGMGGAGSQLSHAPSNAPYPLPSLTTAQAMGTGTKKTVPTTPCSKKNKSATALPPAITTQPIDSAPYPYHQMNDTQVAPTGTSIGTAVSPHRNLSTTCTSLVTSTNTVYFDGLPLGSPLPLPYQSLNWSTFAPLGETPHTIAFSPNASAHTISIPKIPDPVTGASTISFKLLSMLVSCSPVPANLGCTINTSGLLAPSRTAAGAAAGGLSMASILVLAGQGNRTDSMNQVGTRYNFTGAGWSGLQSVSFGATINGPWGSGNGVTGVGVDAVAYEAVTCP